MRKWFWLIGLALVSLVAFHLYSEDEQQLPLVEEIPRPQVEDSLDVKTTEEPQTLYGININDKVVIEERVRPNDNLSTILADYQVSFEDIDQLAREAKGVFDVRKINAHRNYKLICSEDSVAQFMIYEPK